MPMCICDLTAAVCELNCCCDPDCSSADVVVFKDCLPGSEPVIERVCIGQSAIFISNSHLPTVTVHNGSHSYFCVIVTDPKTNYFVSPQSVSRERFPQVSAQYGGNTFISPSQPLIFENRNMSENMSEEFYRLGQQMVTYFANTSTLGMLSLPVALTGGECTDRNPAGFFQTASSSCSRHFTNLSSSCTSLEALNAGTYYQGFTLLQTPDIFNITEVRIEPQNMQSVPTPTLTNNFCNNVVSAVTYRILIEGNVGIIEANVSFSFVNVSLEATKIWQDFHFIFVTDPEQREARRRSGNPGYLPGSPVLAFQGQEPVALSLVHADEYGRCDTSYRNTVVFTLNSRTGCSHSLDPAATCRERQESINLLLLGNRIPDSLGILGNASGLETSSLTRLLNSPPSAADVKCEVSCRLALKMDVEILWARLGSVSNPQSAILGGRLQYHTQDVQCDKTEITLLSSVTFLDASLPPPPPRDTPSPQEKLPHDIFLPFRGLEFVDGTLGEAGRATGGICIVILAIALSQL